MRLSELFEALSPSQYRPLVKGWDKERYADIFKDPKYQHNKNGTRIIIPLGNTSAYNKSKTQERVEDALSTDGYEVVDYAKGLAKNKKTGQQIKIGKVLTKFERTRLLNAYTSDEVREAVNDDYIVVISRHPYDIAGMSTGRGWTSCMNLDHGDYKEFVPLEIESGSIVAYVTTKNDPDLKNPTGRLMIKPFVDVTNPKDIYFGIESKIYGTRVNGFVEAVSKWVDEVNDRKLLDNVVVVKLSRSVYNDGIATNMVLGNQGEEADILERLVSDPDSIKDMENPTEKQMMVAIKSNPYVFKFIKDPSEKIILFTLEEDWGIFYFVKDPSEAVQLSAVSKRGSLVRNIPNPSDAVQEAAVKNAANAIQFIENPSKKLQLLAVNRYGASIKYLSNPSPAVQLAAVRNDDEAFEHIKNPTPEAKAEHIKLYRS